MIIYDFIRAFIRDFIRVLIASFFVCAIVVLNAMMVEQIRNSFFSFGIKHKHQKSTFSNHPETGNSIKYKNSILPKIKHPIKHSKSLPQHASKHIKPSKTPNFASKTQIIRAALPKRDTRTYNINKLAKVTESRPVVRAVAPENSYTTVSSFSSTSSGDRRLVNQGLQRLKK